MKIVLIGKIEFVGFSQFWMKNGMPYNVVGNKLGNNGIRFAEVTGRRLKNTAFSRNLQYAIQRMRKNLIKKLLDNRLGILYLSNVG